MADHHPPLSKKCYGLVVPRQETRRVKVALQSCGLFDKATGVTAWAGDTSYCVVPTTMPAPAHAEQLGSSGQLHAVADVPAQLRGWQSHGVTIVDGAETRTMQRPFVRAMDEALKSLPLAFMQNLGLDAHQMLHTLPSAYNVYTPMLLLPTALGQSKDWMSLFEHLEADPTVKTTFYNILNKAFRTTHVALNAPILALHGVGENMLRSPTSMRPLFGCFGTAWPPSPEHVPSHTDFDEAFWVSTTQNAIKQVWAPRFTMFSAGNVSEKHRVLNLSSVHDAVVQGESTGGCCAVDLFAGIGYFAFSYRMAGCDKVLCWDLNPWSAEGLRRGAMANRWSCTVIETDDELQISSVLGNDFVVFRESNVHASGRIEGFRKSIPKIRHVNCGMLPTACAAWRTALDVLDPHLGGWLHVHETIHDDQKSLRVQEIFEELVQYQSILNEKHGRDFRINLDHLETVKSVRPRVSHYVLDVAVLPYAIP